MFWNKNNSDESKDKFTIEYYPYSRKYYALCNGQFMTDGYPTGIIRLVDRIILADPCKTEEEATKRISLYKEQQYKENVKVIEVT